MYEDRDSKFEQLFQEYKNLIYKVAYNVVKDYNIAQEICQNTFIKLFSNMENISSDEMIKPWLIITAKNNAIDYLRKCKRRNEELTDDIICLMDEKSFNVNRDSIDFILAEQERRLFRDKILQKLRESNEDWYEIIVMTICMEMSQEEVAKAMGISKRMLQARLYRARLWLWENYGEEFKEMIK